MSKTVAKYEKYAEYKDSGYFHLGEIPKDWKILKLKHLTRCLDGQRIPLNAIERGEKKGNIPYWGANKIVDYVDDWIFYEQLILLGEDGAPFFDPNKDVAFLVNGKIWPNNHVHVLRPFKKLVNPTFLTYAINCTDFSLYISGSTRDKLNQSDMDNICIRYCSQAEQTQIANFLDHETTKIDSLIEKQQQLIQLLKEKRQAVISHAVTKGLNPNVPMKDSGLEWLGQVPEHWVRYAIKNLCYVNDGNHGEEYPTEADFVENGEGVPFIRAGDFEDFRVVSKNLRYISQEKNNSMRKGRLQENDILFVNRGATIGKLCIIDKAYAGSNLNSQIAYLRADKTLVDYRYLTYFLSSLYTQTNIVSSIYGGALPQYPIQNIINLDVWSGGLEEQSMIADYLDEQVQIIIYLIGKCELAIKLLQERRTALISAAVTGKIDVRNWQNPTEAKMEFSA